MDNYKKMYLALFNAIADAIERLQAVQKESVVSDVIIILQTAQQNSEEAYMSAGESLDF